MSARIPFRLVLAVVLSIGLGIGSSGCGKSPDRNASAGGSNPPAPENKIDTESIEQAHTVAKAAVVTCGETSCSPSVGMLSVILPPEADPDGGAAIHPVGTCSAFLVVADVVATDAHCVPADLWQAGASCRDRIWMNFAQGNGLDAAQIECATVLSVSHIVSDRADPNYLRLPDYAFLRLTASANRAALSFKTDGLADGQQLSIIKVDPTSNTAAAGRIKKQTCTAVQGTELVPSFNDRLRPIATFSGCQVIEGDSGSPILDSAGNVRAILYAGKAADDLPGVVFATNAACLATLDGTTPNAVSPECAVTPGSAAGRAIKPAPDASDLQKTGNAIDDAAQEWGAKTDGRFEWTSFSITSTSPELAAALKTDAVPRFPHPLSASGLKMYGQLETFVVAAAQLKCFQNPSKWLSKYHHLFSGYEASATVDATSPLWIAFLGTDAEYHLASGEEAMLQTLSIEVRFSPADLNRTGQSQATLTVRDARYGTYVIGSGAVETCKTSASRSGD